MASYSSLRNLLQLRVDAGGRTRTRSYHIKDGATADEVWALAGTIAGLMANTVNEVRRVSYDVVSG